MTLKQYVPLSILVLMLVIAATLYFNVPPWPFVLILLAGETLLGFQLEDGKVPRFLAEIFGHPKGPQTH